MRSGSPSLQKLESWAWGVETMTLFQGTGVEFCKCHFFLNAELQTKFIHLYCVGDISQKYFSD